MKKSLSNKVLLAIFTSFFAFTPMPNAYGRSSCSAGGCGCECGGSNSFRCPESCRGCYDCPSPCECHTIHPCVGAPFLQYRSQSLNKAKEIVGWQPYIHLANKENLYGALYSSIEFTSSFRANQIAHYLFGDDLANGKSLIIQGSTVTNRHPKAWLADYFGLPTDFESIVSFCPKIKNVIVDLNTFIGLNRIAEGLYIKIHMPIVRTQWELNISECIKNPGQEPFKEGYMAMIYIDEKRNSYDIPRDELPCSFIDAVKIGTTFGDQTSSLLFGRMPCTSLEKLRFSDIHFSFGYDFICTPDRHLGAYAHVAAPTGNLPNALYLFEPIVGNGKHWELGLGMSGSWDIWNSECDPDKKLTICFDGVVTHMFNACQARSFDLCGKPNSRYMLLTEMATVAETENDANFQPGSLGFIGADNAIEDIFNVETDPDDEGKTTILTVTAPVPVGPLCFANYVHKQTFPAAPTISAVVGSTSKLQRSNIIPAINYTTRIVRTNIDIQADIAIKLGYQSQDFNVDIGYNFWIRTQEKFNACKQYCKNEPLPRYAIKGDSYLFRKYALLRDNSDADGDGVPENVTRFTLSSTQSKADIHTGQNMKLSAADAALNKGADNPQLAWLTDDLALPTSIDPRIPVYNPYVDEDTGTVYDPYTDKQIYSSCQPILVNPQDLNTCQSTRAMTHKVFFNFQYQWRDPMRTWKPFAGFGGQAEFAPKKSNWRAISQWGIWLKAGVGFK